MKQYILIIAVSIGSIIYAKDKPATQEAGFKETPISYSGFLQDSLAAETHRHGRRINAKTFLKYTEDKDTIILDTRSRAKFNLRHIKGAVHLNFSDFTKESLAGVIPGKKTRILIYCNNNFYGDPGAFPTKSKVTALNIPTFIHLYAYGYKNVYELGSYESVFKTSLNLVQHSN